VRILILGSTRFPGRAITEATTGRGNMVTLFNLGATSPGLGRIDANGTELLRSGNDMMAETE
jgi:hypothetical protein